MKKIFKALFMLSLMALPFIFTSCEKDHGTSGYGSYGDDDWKKYDGENPSIGYEEAVMVSSEKN
ncbi:MAG: hypothetical protein MJZ94_10870 [Bacteroidales bacterium]|nr:hypothetical protein [Bacteroidales bacterium]